MVSYCILNDCPVFNEDDFVSNEVKCIQSGILDFVSHYASAEKTMELRQNIKSDLYLEIFNIYIKSENISPDIIKSFYVNDNYCSDGNQIVDTEKNKWSIQ